MPGLRYLTVQDVLWTNLQVTKRVNHYSAARLEEATYYQYAYGDSVGVPAQAARLLSGFVRLRPLEAGNDATALLATLAFLEINGYTADLSEAEVGPWARDASRSLDHARRAIGSCVRHRESGHDGPESHTVPATVRDTVGAILARYPRLPELLTDPAPVAA